MRYLLVPRAGIVTAILFLLTFGSVLGAPPVFDPIGEERSLNSNLLVVEGENVEFTVAVTDPDGDPLTRWAEDTESWMHFNPDTGRFYGFAPYWSDNTDTRINSQPGVYDVTFGATDGEYTVEKIVSIYVIDSHWNQMSMAGLVAGRPVQAGSTVGTPVTLRNVTDTTVWSDYGGGKNLRRITFGFTGQVPDIPGWEGDWAAETNYAFLPLDPPAAENVGAVIEGGYAGEWGELYLAERACAELDIPVLIVDRDWAIGTGVELMSRYDTLATELRSPEHLFYTFSGAHYLRSADALVTVIDTMTDWPVSYEDFRIALTGHSKFGHACYTAAAADPDRVIGVMPSGYAGNDSGSVRLLDDLQGANGSGPESSRTYRGVMQKYFVEPLVIEDEMNSDLRILMIEGSDDNKGADYFEKYTPKYGTTVSDGQITLPHRMEFVPNLVHTTKSPEHSTCWSMWLAHSLLGRPLSSIDSISHTWVDGHLEVSAEISGEPEIEEVDLWATNEDDTVYSVDWNKFTTYPISLNGGVYQGRIPPDSTAYFVEVADLAEEINGLLSTPPQPTDRNYPLLPLPPEEIADFQATVNPPYIDLTWTNPDSSDFIGVAICYSTDDYPTGPVGGTLIYDGRGESCSHPARNATYYYSAFTYDSTGDYSEGSRVSQAAPVSHLIIENGDYDGDGHSDIALFRPDTGLWAVRGQTRFYFGEAGDIPVPGDYYGDGTAGIGIFRGSSGLWAIRGLTRFYFGSYLDRPVPGDYNGDGSCDMGIFRASSGLWAIRDITRSYFGADGDEPVPGDYDGNYIAGIGVFRPDTGLWAIRDLTRVYFGGTGDEPVPGDYNGDGFRNVAIFRPGSGLWAIRGITRSYFGASSDYPVAADYASAGSHNIGIFRSSNGLWAVKGLTRIYYGGGGDLPVIN